MRYSLLLAASLALAGCSDNDDDPPPSACAGCAGCCDALTGCQEGTTTQYCGPAGGTCSSCAAHQICKDGLCVEGQTSCQSGCTVPETSACITPGTSNEACGPAGGICTNCSASEQICDAIARSCTDRPAECDPLAIFSCKSQESYCDAEGICRSCSTNTFNCDGDSGNGCERQVACDQPLTECASEIGSWPEVQVVASSNAVGNLTQAELRLSTGQPFTLLRLEDFHRDTSYPKTVTFSSASKWNGCDVCVLVAQGCTGFEGSAENYYTCTGKIFLAQQGTAVIEQADVQPSPGAFKAVLSNLKLVEWNESLDQPVPEGSCWKVQSATVDASW